MENYNFIDQNTTSRKLSVQHLFKKIAVSINGYVSKIGEGTFRIASKIGIQIPNPNYNTIGWETVLTLGGIAGIGLGVKYKRDYILNHMQDVLVHNAIIVSDIENNLIDGHHLVEFLEKNERMLSALSDKRLSSLWTQYNDYFSYLNENLRTVNFNQIWRSMTLQNQLNQYIPNIKQCHYAFLRCLQQLDLLEAIAWNEIENEINSHYSRYQDIGRIWNIRSSDFLQL